MAKYQSQIRPGFSRVHLDKDIPFIVPIKFSYIVGIVGKKYCGKSEVIKYLVSEHDFMHYSLAYYVKKERMNRGLFISPDDYQNRTLKQLGDLLRKHEIGEYREILYPGGYLARQFIRELRRDIVEKGLEARKIVVEGFKNPGEINVLKEFAGERLALITINAEIEKRMEWAKKDRKIRFGMEDTTDFIEYYDLPDMDDLNDKPFGRNIDECIKLIDPEHIINNDGDVRALFERIDEILNRYKSDFML